MNTNTHTPPQIQQICRHAMLQYFCVSFLTSFIQSRKSTLQVSACLIPPNVVQSNISNSPFSLLPSYHRTPFTTTTTLPTHQQTPSLPPSFPPSIPNPNNIPILILPTVSQCTCIYLKLHWTRFSRIGKGMVRFVLVAIWGFYIGLPRQPVALISAFTYYSSAFYPLFCSIMSAALSYK